ncbi:1-acyl-sn-glycerol-3-phosphate acyltransferase [Homoserinibacter sp. GY 40078]|uniref:lysophospholipid acyltransferase family protein n=1 Tax=Homoserinibacter sp. GY 40078 TaxID=2603275 RepID=UPI0011C7E792|nr:lysophospholipid acyltransferase family protein [Homoserinibacter sp. GY 40078]TXK17700.1 1-acyl-sn-glycerol-3-phosphate acyltransferase [Homoserinibacter sp. GY 40078]
MFYQFLKNVIVGPFLLSVYRPWVRGSENVPKQGPVIFASNHLSFMDSIFLPLVVDRQIRFLAKSEYFTGRGLRGWIVKRFFLAVGQLPIDRSGGKASEASLNSGLEHLATGGQLGIYPEGTRSHDGRLYRGRTGIARMVLESGALVVPVAMIDTEKVMPVGTKIPKVRRVGIVFGEPLDFSRFAGLEGDRFVLRSITDEIMYELSRLSGQEYVDAYASSVKGRTQTAKAREAVVAARTAAPSSLG